MRRLSRGEVLISMWIPESAALIRGNAISKNRLKEVIFSLNDATLYF